jgi:mRNA-degrading endonuclease toxin of MazEF toxin-antitoxin module
MEEDLKRFDIWNDVKKILNEKIIKETTHFYEREVWWTSLGKNIGSEENGKNKDFERPCLIFRIFNKDVLWVIPLTTKLNIKNYRNEYLIKNYDSNSVADITQLRLISSKRLLRYRNTISYDDFQNIRKMTIDLI